MSDPWSRRQKPISVPKVTLRLRLRPYLPIGGAVLGTMIFYSRFIYDVTLRRWLQPETVTYVDIHPEKLGFGKIPKEELEKRREEFAAFQKERQQKQRLQTVNSLV